jgi:hypothetical protein
LLCAWHDVLTPVRLWLELVPNHHPNQKSGCRRSFASIDI